MSRLLSVVLLLCSISFASAQTTPETVLNAVVTRHGGSALQVANSRVAGTLSYQGKVNPFTLTVQQRSVRFDLNDPAEAFSMVRQDRQGQAIRASKREFAEHLPPSSSHINLSPAFALLHFANDPRFARSLVAGTDGSVGLRFTEGTPPGFKPPPFPQEHWIVTFWIDSNAQITSVTYSTDFNPLLAIAYRYSYDSPLMTPFLQPKRVDYWWGSRAVWSAQIASASVNVSTATDFFEVKPIEIPVSR